jgi:capsular polysaccharide biosynthesis protein
VPDPHPPTFVPALGEGGFDPFVRAIRRHPLLVAVVTLAAVAGAGAWLLLRSHHYQATAEVLVTPATFDDPTYTGLPVLRDTSADPTRATQTAASIIDSPAAATSVAQTLGRGWSVDRVRAAITVTPTGGSNVLAIQATADEGPLAARLANTFVRAALDQRRQTLSGQATALISQLKAAPRPPSADEIGRLLAVSHGFDPSFVTLHDATPPRAPAGSGAGRIVPLALFVGLVLGTTAALLLEVVVRRARTEAEVVELAPRGRAERG